MSDLAHLISAEWLKVRTTRLLHGTVPIAVAISAAAVGGTVVASDGAGALESAHDVREVLSSTGAGALVVLVTGIVLAVGVVTAVAAVAVAGASYAARDATFPLDGGEVWATLAGTLAYTTLFAVVGVGLGALVRNQVVAVTAALAWVAVVEHIFIGFAAGLGRWLPFEAGQAIVRTPLDELLSPLAGTAVLALYAAAFAVAGLRATATRDV